MGRSLKVGQVDFRNIIRLQQAAGCRLLFGVSGSLLAPQKLGFLRKLRFNFVEAALSDDLKSGYPFHRL